MTKEGRRTQGNFKKGDEVTIHHKTTNLDGSLSVRERRGRVKKRLRRPRKSEVKNVVTGPIKHEVWRALRTKRGYLVKEKGTKITYYATGDELTKRGRQQRG